MRYQPFELQCGNDSIAPEIWIVLGSRFDDKLYGLVPLSALASDRNTLTTTEGGRVIWRSLADGLCDAEIRLACGLVEFEEGSVNNERLLLPAPFSATTCPIECAYGRPVSILGEEWRGRVKMLHRPVTLALKDGRYVTLRDTIGVCFEKPESGETRVKPGAMLMTGDTCQPLGIILGGNLDYCLAAPLSPLLSEQRFFLALHEKISAKSLTELTRAQRQEASASITMRDIEFTMPAKWGRSGER